MYRRRDDHPVFENFLLPFDGKLDQENRWVRLSKLIPWDLLEDLYGSKLSDDMGRPGKNVRVAFGAQIIKHKLNLSDAEVVEQIRKNPYLQFFIGLEEFRTEAPFDASLMTTFRKRFNLEDVFDINDLIEKRVRLLADGNILSAFDIELLEVIRLLHHQQNEMYVNKKHSVKDRIVSISQPWIRPIVRGKASADVEFGAKLSLSLVDGIARIDRLSWDAYNESEDLIQQVEAYKKRNGFYPASVHADGIYRTRANRKYLKDKGIRFSGKPLGRPPKETDENKATLKERRTQARQDEVDRIPVEVFCSECTSYG